MANLKSILKYAIVGVAIAVLGHIYFSIERLPRKFELYGKIDECCCDAELLKDVNDQIVHLTEDLSETLFFKIFKVNLFNDCPFWAQEFLCTSPNGRCQICQCDENEIPLPWKQEKTSLISSLQQDFAYNFAWHAGEKDYDKGIYVDLKKNPEVFTGYQGQNVWKVIYGENCFQGPLQEMCLEERLLNRIISGLHTSISTQLSYYYNTERNKTYPNPDLFFEKVGDHPDRMANLYFAHSVLLRAINRAHEYIQNYNYDTGDYMEDLKTRKIIDQLYNVTLQRCDQPFDEKELFASLSRAEVNKHFISYFYNISQIMDCVECETCKVYGKLQTLGIASALKILFAEKFTGQNEVHLKRNELIALFVTFYKFSTSLSYIDRMYEKRYSQTSGMFKGISLCVAVFLVMVKVLYKVYETKSKKLTNGIRENFKYINEFEKAQKRTS